MTSPQQARTVRLALAGLQVELDLSPGHADLAAELEVLWSHALDGTAAADPLRLRVRSPLDPGVEGSMLVRPGPSAAYELSGHLTREAIRTLKGKAILLHAGAVDHPDAGTLLVVGPSGAGKSTATRHLARGGGYLSDELAILEPAGLGLLAFPKPVSLVDGSLPGRGKRDVALPELGLRPVPSAPRPSQVILLDRESDAETGLLERVDLAEALLVLVKQSSSLWTVPGGLGLLAEVLRGAGGALRARYREAEQLTELLGDLPAPQDEIVEALPSPADDSPPIPPGAFVPAPRTEAIATMNGVVVLGEGRVMHAPGLAGLVWEELALDGPLTPGQIEDRLVTELGAHPDSGAILGETLDVFLRDGWLRTRPE